MRVLYFILIIILFSCKKESPATEKFEHELFSIEYPKSWEKLDNEGMILTISKYSKLEASIEGENPNLIIVSTDSTDLSLYGINNFDEFIRSFKDNQLSKNNIELEEGIYKENINNAALNVIKYKVRSEYLTFLQTHYFFNNYGQYVAIIITHEYGKNNEELSKIVKTLELAHYEPLEFLSDEE